MFLFSKSYNFRVGKQMKTRRERTGQGRERGQDRKQTLGRRRERRGRWDKESEGRVGEGEEDNGQRERRGEEDDKKKENGVRDGG